MKKGFDINSIDFLVMTLFCLFAFGGYVSFLA